MQYEDIALTFYCQGARLTGILSKPQQAIRRGVLFVVGGPQYRIGSHRQFTLLARQLAGQGIPVLRFDYRGMGDSEGMQRDFTQIDEDIRAALDCFFQQEQQLQEVVLWGLCDAATASLHYSHQDPRVSGVVLVNPWVRTEQGMAKAYLKHYYLQRLLEFSLWKKVVTGQFNPISALGSLGHQVLKLVANRKSAEGHTPSKQESGTTLPNKLLQDLRQFKGRVLCILCSNDLTAQEFSDLSSSSPEWKKLMSAARVTCLTLEAANHTFSQRNWREKIGAWTIAWCKSD
ncbi:hydrolase 1, exosortase A system-associated [Undibacterium sp.]|uniref:hydrolase 1, exosortase A system-associated n=1 Tax=Undibacterium sp. TaxID=1914977 RepID=UPI0025F99570|nr:hydrolase 1, exosortase A system-associated [Undibacterium sp.]